MDLAVQSAYDAARDLAGKPLWWPSATPSVASRAPGFCLEPGPHPT